jgi:small subunit ribosomal protein S7
MAEKKVPLLIFDKFDLREVKVTDRGLEKYISLDSNRLHSSARYVHQRFGKSKISIVERLINNLMRSEKYTGKKLKTIQVVRDAFELIAKKSNQNPVQVFINALQNAAPREEATRLMIAGISIPKAVDVAPQRRIDIGLRSICKGATRATYNSKKSIEECLADELIKASKNDSSTYSVGKKDEIERIAKSAR